MWQKINCGLEKHLLNNFERYKMNISEVRVKIVQNGNELDTLFFVLFILGFQNELLTEWRKQGATVDSLELEQMQNTKIPIPPEGEQREIINLVKKRMADIDTLIVKSKAQISKYQEYRTTMISEVVTGKIDVRNEVIP